MGLPLGSEIKPGPIQECPHDDDLDIQPQTDMIRRMGDRVPAKRTVSPYTPMPVPPADTPQLGPWRVAVVRVEETPTGDASGTEHSCATTDRKRPIDLPEVAGNDDPILLAAPPPPPELV